MPEIQTKRFLWIAFHRFPLTIDKITWSLTIFIDFDFYLLASPGSNYALNWGYFERTVGLHCEKLGAKKPGQYQPSEEHFTPGLKEKIRFFTFFYWKDFFKKVIIVWSLDSQLHLNCQQICYLLLISFYFWMNRYISTNTYRWNR